MLGELDAKILVALSENGRASWSELGRRFSVSRVTIQNRVESMQARKIIKGYTVIAAADSGKVEVSEEKTFLLVQFADGGSVFTLQKFLAASPNVLGIWGVAGEWDCFVLLHAPSLKKIAALREHIFDKIKIKRLETHPVLNDFPALLTHIGG
ncbi:Lrp/AsnC family transcriptional regulator [Candidatus Spongiihabitans sp.]|uniref:Lrp/AsnC family transcriptional regulator n=1 Tax=Candidatus Spongiihabitans sp. TaxID=3101308 RepID=UPI003C7B6C02